MRELIIPYYIFFFLFAVGFSFVINKLFLRAYFNFGNEKKEGYQETQARWSSMPKPLLGGFSFYLLLLFSISVYSMIFGNDLITAEIIGVMLSSSFGFLLGWADDGYGTNPILKFVGQFICANILTGTGLIIQISGLTMVDYMFTVFWIIGIMNSINMLDNMDGITTTTSFVIGLVCLILALDLDGSQHIYSSLLVAVCGALIGFLFFNISPAKMYMGDTGSQFLGVFLGAISIPLLWSFRTPEDGIIQVKQFMVPLLVFAIPILDTATVFIRRIMRKQSPFIGGKDHTTHHLVYLGASERGTMFIFMGANMFFGALGLWVASSFESVNIWHCISIIVGYIAFFSFVQYLYNIAKRKELIKTSRKVIHMNIEKRKNA